MGEMIAQTYEIVEKIGSGGGGNVFLAKHIRLDKMVVLKADKRKVTTRPELLRREVDVLKNLRHTYIPQVYDFFVIDDTVYTVMDYIEGESLDRPLKRGEQFGQPEVIKWGREILEALSYLHSPTHGSPPRGFVHSDIKPANVMLKPDGHICLIDFNIALALGEEAVIGGSAGYASPEHYGLDYSFSGTQSMQNTETMEDDATRTMTIPPKKESLHSSSKRVIMPDVRSDIYSLGATLYHMLSGRRPAKDATEVIPLTTQDASRQVVDIVTKAMNPNPDLRYQSADEMLDALNGLRRNDLRAVRHRKVVKIGAACLATIFIAGAVSAFVGSRRMNKAERMARIAEEQARIAEEQARIEAERAEEEERRKREMEEAARAALSNVTRSEEAFRNGDIPEAKEFALSALKYDSPYKARAQKALTEAVGVYDMSDGFKVRLCIELGTEPRKLSVSPDGAFFAVLSDGKVQIYETEGGELVGELPADRSALSDAIFAGESTLIYAGKGALTAYDIKNSTILWTAAPATNISVSNNAVAAVYRDETTAYVYDLRTGAPLYEVELPGPLQSVPENDIFMDAENDLFVLNEQTTHLTVSVEGGGLQVINLEDRTGDIEIFQKSAYIHFEGGFFGKYLAFSATGDGRSVFAVIDVENIRQTGGFSSTSPFHVQADTDGVFLSLEDVLVELDPETGDQTEVAYTNKDIIAFKKAGDYALVATEDDKFMIFGPDARLLDTWNLDVINVELAAGVAVVSNVDETQARVLRLETRSDADILSYDPKFTHSEARLSADRKTVTMFRFDRMRVYSMDGTVLANVEFPDSEKIYDQQFRRNGDDSLLEVTWYDGTVRSYSAADGALINETKSDPPDTSLYVEYMTEKFRVEAPMNGSPAVYDIMTGELVGQLQSDDFLTYIYDSAGYTVAEYMTGDGRRYGVLLTDELEPLAELPNLCDVFPDGTLLFDDDLGTLRQSRIYTIQELIALANSKEDQYEKN